MNRCPGVIRAAIPATSPALMQATKRSTIPMASASFTPSSPLLNLPCALPEVLAPASQAAFDSVLHLADAPPERLEFGEFPRGMGFEPRTHRRGCRKIVEERTRLGQREAALLGEFEQRQALENRAPVPPLPAAAHGLGQQAGLLVEADRRGAHARTSGAPPAR